MDLKGKGKGEESSHGASRPPTGSPSRMEMGASNMQNAAETPIPETPPNGPAVNFGLGSQGGSCFGQSFAPGLVGNAPNLACAGNLAGAPNFASVQNLASFQNLLAPQQCFWNSRFSEVSECWLLWCKSSCWGSRAHKGMVVASVKDVVE